MKKSVTIKIQEKTDETKSKRKANKAGLEIKKANKKQIRQVWKQKSKQKPNKSENALETEEKACLLH